MTYPSGKSGEFSQEGPGSDPGLPPFFACVGSSLLAWTTQPLLAGIPKKKKEEKVISIFFTQYLYLHDNLPIISRVT